MARRRNPDDEILIALMSGTWTSPNGQVYDYYQGKTRVRAAHELAKACPYAFKPIDVHYDVERATAAPGEVRGD